MRRWFTEPRTMVSSDHRSCGRSPIRGLRRKAVRAYRNSDGWIRRGQTGVRHVTDPVRRGLLPSCDGAPTAAAWGAVTARQEAAPDRVRRLTNSCLATTDPSVANPVPPDGLPEEPSDDTSTPKLPKVHQECVRHSWPTLGANCTLGFPPQALAFQT